jgi:hypothetical protein
MLRTDSPIGTSRKERALSASMCARSSSFFPRILSMRTSVNKSGDNFHDSGQLTTHLYLGPPSFSFSASERIPWRAGECPDGRQNSSQHCSCRSAARQYSGSMLDIGSDHRVFAVNIKIR